MRTRTSQIRRQRSPHATRVHAIRAWLCCAVGLVATACPGPPGSQGRSPPESTSLAELHGAIVTDAPFLVLPNRAWRRHSQRPAWFFAGVASLICHVLEPPQEPITFGFIPEGDRAGPRCLEALWNGADVSDRIRITATGELQVELSPPELTTGTHYLTLRRCSTDDSAAVTFARIGYRLPGSVHELAIDELLRYWYLADLLSFGVTGSYGPEKLGGFVFDGPRSAVVGLPDHGWGRFSATIQNSSPTSARFTLRGGDEVREVELESHQRQRVEMTVPEGTAALELAVEGAEDGFYLWGSPLYRSASDESRPTIILITLDTTRRDVLAAYGGDPAITPALDALARWATVYEHAYATAPWTLPSHASVMTGLYPSRHGGGVTSDHLESRFETLAERLRAHGYQTAGFAGGMLSGYRFGLAQGFGVYRDPDGTETLGDRLTDHVRDFLEKEVETGGARPLFLFVNYFDPHFPYRAPESFRRAHGVPATIAGAGSRSEWTAVLDGSGDAWSRAVSGALAAPAAAVEAIGAAYRAEVSFMDHEVGRLLDLLRSSGIFEDALIVVTADHGELLGESGFFSHSARLDPEVVAIPLIVKHPRQRHGRRSQALVSLVDLFPTMLRSAGLPVPDQDGIALVAENSDALDRRPYVWIEEHDTSFHRLFANMKIAGHVHALQGRSFRRVSWRDGSDCFAYRRSTWQRQDCPGAGVADRELVAAVARTAWRPQEERIGPSDVERSNLRALGYIP